MKVWELMVVLSRAPANSEVLIEKGDKFFHIDGTSFQDWDYEGFDLQMPVNLEMGREDK